MKKRKPVMKLLTLIMAMTLMLSMSAITAFAASEDENKSECCTTDSDGETTCTHTDDECDMDNCPIHSEIPEGWTPADGAKTDSDENADENKPMTISEDASKDKDKGETTETTDNKDKDKADTAEDKDKADTAEKKDKDKGETVSGNSSNVDKDKGDMNADTKKDDTETVKTGETDIVPIIVALGIIAIGAGAAYTVFRKKHA